MVFGKMAKVINSVADTETENIPPATGGAKPPPRRLPWRKLLFGLVALVVLGGLVALALMATTGSETVINRATPIAQTASPSTTSSGPTATLAGSSPAIVASLNQLAAYPGDYQVLLAAMSDGLRRSTDGGKTWVEIVDFKGRNLTGLVFDLDDPERPAYLAADQTGLFKSTDAGKTWRNLGLAGRPITRLAVAQRHIYLSVAGPRASIYHSADAGQTFTAPALNSLPAILDVQAIAIDSANPQNVYIGTAWLPGGKTPDWGRVKFSGDGGKTWRDLGQWSTEPGDGPNSTRPVTLLLAAQGDRIYIGDGETLWRLTPDRTLWQPVGGGLPPNGVYGLTAEPQTAIQGLVYAATRDGFYRNSDGQSWQKMATGETGLLFSTSANQPPLNIRPGLFPVTTSSPANSVNGLRSTYLYALSSDGRLNRYENREFGTELIAVVPGATNVPDFRPFGGINPSDPVAAPPAGVNDPTKRYFVETGHYIQGEFKNVWEGPGRGLALYGYPLTEQFQEFDVRDKTNKTVQYFERFRFEFDKAGLVRTSLVGYDAIEGRYFPPGRFLPTTNSQQYFDETKHTLRGAFFDFWRKNGDLTRYGFPITEEFTEKSDDGRETVYQYFQRAKLAFDPQTKVVTISLLGREVLQKRGWIK